MRPWTSILFALALTTVACSGPDPGALAGDYRRQHRVFVFHGSEPIETEVEDRLTLQALGEGGLRFALHITASAGQTCEMSGIAQIRREFFEYRDTVNGTQCTLRISRSARGISLEDVDDSCRGRYCGEAASIGRLTLASTR